MGAQALQAKFDAAGRDDGRLSEVLKTAPFWDETPWTEVIEQISLNLRLYHDDEKGPRFTLYESLPGRTSIIFSGRWVPYVADFDFFALIPDAGAPSEARARVGIYVQTAGTLRLAVHYERAGSRWAWMPLSRVR